MKRHAAILAVIAALGASAYVASTAFGEAGSGQSADVRNNDFVVICHYDRNEQGPNAGPHTITISVSALDHHLLNHVKKEGFIGDDSLGPCPGEPTVTPAPTEPPVSPTPGEPSPTPTPGTEGTRTPTPTDTPTPEATAEPPTETATPEPTEEPPTATPTPAPPEDTPTPTDTPVVEPTGEAPTETPTTEPTAEPD